MSRPVVCCVMLTRDRAEMAARAVRCFREQTYENKRLVIFGSGYQCWHYPDFHPQGHAPMNEDDSIDWGSVGDGYTIGDLRNRAIKMDLTGGGGPQPDKPAEIFAHWDDDDFSHPNRLAEQVSLLQASGADAVGYNQALFWDTRPDGAALEYATAHGKEMGDFYSAPRNEAWLYRAVNPQHILGTSLLYWRSTWERQPFDDVPSGEDTRWIAKLGKKAVGVSSLNQPLSFMWENGVFKSVVSEPAMEPRMIASVHGQNSSGYEPEKDRASTKRAPEWDDYCRKVMQL